MGFHFYYSSVYETNFYAGGKFVETDKASFSDVFRVFFALTMAVIEISQSSSLAPGASKAKTASPFAWFDALGTCLANEAAVLLLYSSLQDSASLQYVLVPSDMGTLLIPILEALDDFLCLSIPSNASDSQYRVLEWLQVAAIIGMLCSATSAQLLNEGITLHIEIFSTKDKVKGFVMLLEMAEDAALKIWEAPNKLALFLAPTEIFDMLVMVPLNVKKINSRLPHRCNGSETVKMTQSFEVGLSSSQQWDPGGRAGF